MVKTKSKFKRKKTARRKSNLTLLNLKVSPKDRKRLEKAAKKYANGNLSAWLRYTGMQYRPAKHEKIE